MFSEPSWNCSRMKSCGWSTVTGFMPPDPRRQMRVHPTLFSSAKTVHRFVHSLNRMRCDTGSQCSRPRIKPETCISLHHKASSPRHSSRAADDQEHIEAHVQRGGCCNSQSCWLQSSWPRIWPCRTKRLKRALDTSELVEAAVNNLNISTEYRRVTDRHLVIAVRATMHSNAQ